MPTPGSQSSILPEPGVISLARGIPAPEMFPEEELALCARRAIERHGPTALNYGEAQGFGPLCEWLARRHGVESEQILVTPGSFIGLSFAVRELLQESRRIAIEAPSYDRMLTLLRAVGAEPEPVARAAEGLDLDRLRRLFSGRVRPACLYVLPTFHNPTGWTLSADARAALADLVVELEIVVLEDDPYGLLRFEGEALPHLHTLLLQRGAGHLAIHLSSFSKVVSPGLRVGYTVAPVELLRRLRDRALATYVSPPMLAQAELYEYLDGGFLEPHLEQIRAFLRPRRDALIEGFQQRMPADARWTRPEGGYFVWLELPFRIDATSFGQDATAAGVSVVPGPQFFFGSGGEHGARLSFSYPSVAEIRSGAARLSELVAAGSPKTPAASSSASRSSE
jgi:DNA-binding transcriptional MocR family regulator